VPEFFVAYILIIIFSISWDVPLARHRRSPTWASARGIMSPSCPLITLTMVVMAHMLA